MLCLWLLLDDRRLRVLISAGSTTDKPPAFAKSMRMSVRLTTPTSLPLIRMPGSELAETDGPLGATNGVFGEASATLPESAEAEEGGLM